MVICLERGADLHVVWYGMVSVDLYSAIITKVSNALDTLVSGEKPGFQTLSEGLVVLLCAEVVRQRVLILYWYCTQCTLRWEKVHFLQNTPIFHFFLQKTPPPHFISCLRACWSSFLHQIQPHPQHKCQVRLIESHAAFRRAHKRHLFDSALALSPSFVISRRNAQSITFY